MKDAIGYIRVSTREQGRSGLSLAAQRHDIGAFGAREGFAITAWHQDIQTGAGKDALLLRPGLAAALKEAREARCALIVSRLDRLSRNVHFISGLMEHKVHFTVAALGRDCDDFTLHIYASLAEQERKMISERCKLAIAEAKRKGKKFGVQLRSKAWQRRVSALGRAALVRIANERAEAYRLHIEWAFGQPGFDGRQISYRGAAKLLNARNIESSTGRRWTGEQLARMARRLGVTHPPGYLKNKVVRAHAQSLWNQNPRCTAQQLITSLGTDHRLGVVRAYAHLKACRASAAKYSSAQKRAGWPVDRFTAIRVRIAKILNRQPHLLGREVLEELGADCSVRLQWVWYVMRQYRGASKIGARKRR